MRTPLTLALVAVLALAAGLLAGPLLAGEGGPAADRAALALDVRVQALEGEVAWLRAREAALTDYVLANDARGTALQALADQLVTLGFTQKALPAASREALVEGIRGMGASLREGLPTSTKDQQAMLAWVERVLSAAR